MKGLELSRAFYEEYGIPMIKEQFSQYEGRIACGLVGHGSECFGFDDETSKDHDFEPGFCIWITDEDRSKFGFPLFRAYRKLPTEYKGIKTENKSLFGSDFKGVHTVKEFYSFYTGTGEVPKSVSEWMSIPDFYLAEATNGEVFCDPVGEFTRIRNALKNGRPEDVRLKKLASSIFYMAQCGQYNYSRCMAHGEKTAAAVALSDFVKHSAFAVYLLNKEYAPYYKWLFRGMTKLEILGGISADLEKLMSAPFEEKENLSEIEKVCSSVAEEIRVQNLTDCKDEYLERYAYGITNGIKDSNLRNMPVML